MSRFEIRLSRNKKYYFVLIAANEEVILQSELYESKQGAENGITSIKANAGAPTVENLQYRGKRK